MIAFLCVVGLVFSSVLFMPIGCAPSAKTAGLSRMKQINLGLTMYLDDNEAYPVKAKDLQRSVIPYVKYPDLFNSGGEYGMHVAFNRSLEGSSRVALEAEPDTVNLMGRVNKSPDVTVIGKVDTSVRCVKNERLWELRWRLKE